MRKLVAEADLADHIYVDSAGTGGWHVGEPPDERSVRAAAARGILMEGTARQVRTPDDFDEFDLLLAADRSNLRALHSLAPSSEDRVKIRFLREFDPAADGSDLEVPDPYYGGSRGFDDVIDLVEAACRGLLDHCIDELGLEPRAATR